MIIKGNNFFKNNNNKTYEVIIGKDKTSIDKMIKYFINFNTLNTERFLGIDFEFNRSLDNTMREIALFQINLETNEDIAFIYMFYPPDLDNNQTEILKSLLLNTEIKKLIHGGESLDIPYLFKNLFTDKENQIKFCKNIYDTKYLCEYYNSDNNLIENKCKIYYLLKQMEVVNDSQFSYLLENEEKMGPIYNIRIKVDNMSEALINYCAYDVLYLPELFNKFPKKDKYQKIIPELTSIHFILKQTDFFTKYFKNISVYNNYFTTHNKKKLVEYYNKVMAVLKDKYKNIIEITYFRKFFEIIVKYVCYCIVVSKYEVFQNKTDKFNGNISPNDVLKHFVVFKNIFQFTEKLIYHIKINI
jgi:hypothetical protein